MATPDRKKLGVLQHAQPLPEQKFEDKYYPQIDSYRDDATAKAIRRRQAVVHRHIWSFSLLGLVVLLNLFSAVVVWEIGAGVLRYTTSFAVPAVIAANFGETWALTRIAMKFWFDHTSDE